MKQFKIILLFLRMITMVYCNDIDRGYPGGFLKYGDRNNDGRINQADINANHNMAWLKEWYWITKNLSKTVNKDMNITKEDFTNLLTSLGMLRVTGKRHYGKLRGIYVYIYIYIILYRLINIH